MNPVFERIDKLCRERGEAPTAVCQRCGVNPSRISDLKAGRSEKLSTATLHKLAKALGTTPDYLAYGDGAGMIVVNVDNGPVDFTRLIKNLSNEDLVKFMSAAATELRYRTLPDQTSMEELSDDEILEKIGALSHELAKRREAK